MKLKLKIKFYLDRLFNSWDSDHLATEIPASSHFEIQQIFKQTKGQHTGLVVLLC